jgi:ATP-dependent DNA helicase RecG
MTKTELLELIRNGENSGVEFKRDDIDARSFAKELVAFTNHSGGQVLLGVEDEGSVSGLVRADLEEWVMQACRDKIRPEIIPFFELIRDVEPGKDVAIVTVDRGWSVHALWHNQHRTYYIRVGAICREASPEELARLLQRRDMVRTDIRPVSGAGLDDLDQRRLFDYFQRVRGQTVPSADDADGWRALLVNTELMTQSDDDTARPTVAGLLLFGKNPNRFLPHAGVDAAAFDGESKEYASKERAQIRGPMVPLLSDDGHVTENGLVEQVLEFVRRNTRVTATLVDGARRDERHPYPDEPIREAVVNALVHRDYQLAATDIEVVVYSDRLEIVSPGRLPNGITPTRMLAGCRAARNQLIKDVMRDYGYLEHMGMGVPRKIVKGMKEHNGTEPLLAEEEEAFRVALLA